MAENRSFRGKLLDRLLQATGAGSLGLTLAAACGGATNIAQITSSDPIPSGGSAGSGGAATGGSGGTGGASIAGQSGGGGFILVNVDANIGNPLGEHNVHRCVDALPVDGGAADSSDGASADSGPTLRCPTLGELDLPPYSNRFCVLWNEEVRQVTGGPTLTGNACCYDLVTVTPCFVYVGRAFLVDDGLMKADVRKGGGFQTGETPSVALLDAATRRALRDAWVQDGLFEHASVATFARFAMQLLAVGAPSRLLHETLAAGRDEVRHAELCFGLASAYAGEPLAPGEFPIDGHVAVETDLVGIIEETIVEGCIGETLAALQAFEQAEGASDPAVRSALESTVDDETRHAELAWRVVAWALEVGGEPVRRAAERTFSRFRPPDTKRIDLDGVDLAAFEAHGRLTPLEARRSALEALDFVVRPCAAALLGLDVMARRPVTPAPSERSRATAKLS